MTEEEKIRKVKAEYARKWRKENPDKAKAIANRYWLKKAQVLNDKNQGR